MKKITIILLSVILSVSCKPRIIKGMEEFKTYKIYKIDSINTFYVVYAERDNQKYKIISKKQYKMNGFKKIRIGEVYSFKLDIQDYKNNDSNPLTNPNSAPYIMRCYMFDKNTKICQEQGINGLYTTKNLKGLYYEK